MAQDTPSPVINGYEFDWSSIENRIGDVRYPNSFSKIDYEKKTQRGETRGKGPKRRGTTRGKETCTASFTMFKADFEVFKAQLLVQATGVQTFRDVPFDQIVSYEENDIVYTDTIVGARVNSVKNSHSNGSQDALMVDVELDVTDILLNGAE